MTTIFLLASRQSMKKTSRSKYRSKKVKVDGMVFASKKEADRYKELKLLEKAGEISDLRTQVKYVLIPAQREWTGDTYTKGRKKGTMKPGKIVERECAYIADFVYTVPGQGVIVEDTKGFRTKDYVIKRKLMLYVHGIRIKEM